MRAHINLFHAVAAMFNNQAGKSTWNSRRSRLNLGFRQVATPELEKRWLKPHGISNQNDGKAA